MAAPYVQSGVFLVAGMWMVGPAGLAGVTAPAIGALSGAGTEILTNALGGGNSAMIASSVGQAFFMGGATGSVEAAGSLLGKMAAAGKLSFSGRANMI